VHTPDVLLDGVSTVVQDEDDRGQLVDDHCGQFLNSELPERKSWCVVRPLRPFMYSQTSITNEKDRPSQLEIPSSTGSTKSCTDGEPNTTPQDLGDKCGFLRQGYINDTETRSSGLSNNDILRLEELSDARPQVCLRNGIVGFVGNGIDKWRNGDLLRNLPKFRQLDRQARKELLEADSGVEGMQDSGMVGVKLIDENRPTVSNV